MARPCSRDLRDRAMARLDAGESVRTVAAALSMAPSSVVKWSQRRRATGSAAPGKIGGHAPRKIRGADEAWLTERIGWTRIAFESNTTIPSSSMAGTLPLGFIARKFSECCSPRNVSTGATS